MGGNRRHALRPVGSVSEHSGVKVSRFIELFALGGYKTKLYSHRTFLMNKYMSTTNK